MLSNLYNCGIPSRKVKSSAMFLPSNSYSNKNKQHLLFVPSHLWVQVPTYFVWPGVSELVWTLSIPSLYWRASDKATRYVFLISGLLFIKSALEFNYRVKCFVCIILFFSSNFFSKIRKIRPTGVTADVFFFFTQWSLFLFINKLIKFSTTWS